MMVENVRPFSMVQNTGFIKFVHSLNKKYQLPDRNILSTKLLPELYQAKCAQIKKSLSKVECIHLTVDLWTDNHRQISYFDTTAHYMKDGQLCNNSSPEAFVAVDVNREGFRMDATCVLGTLPTFRKHCSLHHQG